MTAILLATYNGEKYLAEQLDSILAQTDQDFVIYVHDDGSTDATVSILESYRDKYPSKLVIVDGPAQGGSRNNFFYLLNNVEADYYMFSDQDDVWLPEKIAAEKARMKQVEERLGEKGRRLPILIFADMKVVDQDLKVINDSFIRFNNLDTENLEFRRIVVQNVVAGCTTFFNRALRDAGTLDSLEDIRWHDWWLALIASGSGVIEYMGEGYQLYRQHGDNSIGAEEETGIRKILKLLFWFVTMTHIKTTKNMISNFVRQAARLDISRFSGDNRKIIRVMQEFYHMGKMQRIRCFRRYGIRRNKRNGWMMFWL